MMHFTLKHLRYLHTAGQAGSIAKAAQELRISQSSIVAAIDLIEQQLGFDVFLRVPSSGIKPTPAGRDVLGRIGRYLSDTRAFETELDAMSGDSGGVLRLALHTASAKVIVHPVLQVFAQRHPDVRVEITDGDLTFLRNALQNGDVDVVLPFRRADAFDLGFTPQLRTRPFAVLRADHPLAQNDTVSLAELAPLPLVLLDVPAARDRYPDLFTSRDLEPTIRHHVRSIDVARSLVACGLGYSLMNIRDPHIREDELGIRNVAISDDIYAPVYGLAYAKDLRRSPTVERFINIAQDLAEQGAYRQLVIHPEGQPLAPL